MAPDSDESDAAPPKWHTIKLPRGLYAKLLIISDERELSLADALNVYIDQEAEKRSNVVEKVVEKVVEVPVERVVTKTVEVPVVRNVEKEIEVACPGCGFCLTITGHAVKELFEELKRRKGEKIDGVISFICHAHGAPHERVSHNHYVCGEEGGHNSENL